MRMKNKVVRVIVDSLFSIHILEEDVYVYVSYYLSTCTINIYMYMYSACLPDKV